MLLVSLIGWWYGKGFLVRLDGLKQALGRTADAFSIGMMLKTLFNPFRQIDAGATGRGIGENFSALISRLISRLVGFVARTVMIIVGLVVLLLQLIGSLIVTILHVLTPILPVAGVVAMIVGWTPEVILW